MSSQESQHSQGPGVILNPGPNKSSRSRRWTFTVNNPTADDLKSLDLIVSGASKYIWGFEGKEENKTDHIQGYVHWKHQRTFGSMKLLLPRAHWEKAKGTEQQNYTYCSKEGNFVTNIEPKVTRSDIVDLVRQSYNNVTWRLWQQDVINIADAAVDPRAIHWIYEKTGNAGKTFLAKFLALRPGTIVCQGKASDVFNAVNVSIESGARPQLVLVDVPRVTIDYVSYNALECLKNGMLYSGKYEGGLCIFPSPHVICFANEMPNTGKMSLDRWRIYEIKEQMLFEKMI